MNLLLLDSSEYDGDRVELRDRRALHVADVLRAQPGERIRVGVVRESVGTAEVLSVEGDRLLLGAFALETITSPSPVRLVIALPRPKAVRRLLQTAASFGVDHIDLVNAWRVHKGYWDSPALGPDALLEQVWLGCEQGAHAWLPTIKTHRLLMPFLAELQEQDGPRLLAHPGSALWLGDVDLGPGAVTFAIGPEGGWIEKELASLEGIGFQRISVSQATLRSEIALAATLAQWEMLTLAQ